MSGTGRDRAAAGGVRLGGFARGAAVYLAGTAAGGLLVLATTAVLARRLGPELFGLLALGLAVSLAFSALSRFGLDHATVRFLAPSGEGDATGPTLRRLLALSLGTAGVAAELQWALAPAIAGPLLDQPGLARFLRALSPFVFCGGPLAVLLAALRARDRPAAHTFARDLAQPAVALVFFLAAAAAGAALFGALWHRAAGAAAGLILAALLVGRLLAAGGGRGVARRRLASFAWPMFLADFGFLLAGWVDVVMLGLLGTAADVGLYRAAIEIRNVPLLVLGGLILVASPAFSRLHHDGERSELERLYRRVARWAVILAGPVLGAGLAFPELVLELFGDRYRGAAPVLALLLAGQLVHLASGPGGALLAMAGHPRLQMVNAWGAGLVNVLLNALLIPRLGVAGAALATTLSLALVNLAALIEIRLVVGISPLSPRLVGLVAGGAALFGAAAWSARLLGAAPTAGWPALGAGIALWALVAWRLGLTPGERRLGGLLPALGAVRGER